MSIRDENNKSHTRYGEERKTLNRATLLAPVPVVMVTCGDMDDSNIITLAWTGIICSEPAMLSISVRKSRYSYNMIKEKGVFAVNLVSSGLTKAADYCGVTSGKNTDKFKDTMLTKAEGNVIQCPIIKQSPLSIECRVKSITELGSHDMFMAEIVSVSADSSLFENNGELNLERADLVAYSHGKYYSLGKRLGFFGYSIAKDKVLKRRQK